MDLSYKGINAEKIKQIQRIRFPHHIPCTEQVKVDLQRTFSSDDFKVKDSVVDAIRLQIESYQKKYMEDYEMFVICEMAKLFLKAKPVVYGEWVGNACSACGMNWDENMVNNADDWGYFEPMPIFCQNCGADMRKKVE